MYAEDWKVKRRAFFWTVTLTVTAKTLNQWLAEGKQIGVPEPLAKVIIDKVLAEIERRIKKM